MNHPLQAKELSMGVSKHDEIMSILPYIHPKPLEMINIYEPSQDYNTALNLDEIGHLEQWKQAEKLKIKGFQIPDLFQNLIHFSKIVLSLQDISIEVPILLKEMFLCSSTLSEMIIHNYGNFTQDVTARELIEAFGQPFVVRDQDRNWFFRTSNTNQFLRIKYKYNQIFFNRIEQLDVPRNAIISN